MRPVEILFARLKQVTFFPVEKNKPAKKLERVPCPMNKTVVKMMVSNEKIQNFDAMEF